MNKKSNIGLVEFCYRALKEQFGYVNGSYCYILSQERYDKQICNPDLNTYNYRNRASIKPFIGKMVSDCYGLVKGYCWQNPSKNPVQASYEYGTYSDRNQEGAFLAAIRQVIPKGTVDKEGKIFNPIQTLSANYKAGMVVWLKGHAGVAVNKLPNGNVEIIECRGHYPSMRKGIVTPDGKCIGTSNWTNWFEDTYIDYTELPNSSGTEDKMRYFELLTTMNFRKTIDGTILSVIPKGTLLQGSSITKAGNGTEWLLTLYKNVQGYVAVSSQYAKEIFKDVPVAPVKPPTLEPVSINYKLLYETIKKENTVLTGQKDLLNIHVNELLSEKATLQANNLKLQQLCDSMSVKYNKIVAEIKAFAGGY